MTQNGKKILVTGGAGFIGSNFIHHALTKRPDWRIFNLDRLTYAGNLMNVKAFPQIFEDRYTFIHGDICDNELLKHLFSTHSFDGVFHLAAESHVDRSIVDPESFVQTNLIGTFRLLEASQNMWEEKAPADFRWFQ